MLYDNGGLPAPQRPTGAYRAPGAITPPVRPRPVPPPTMTPKLMRDQLKANMPPSMRRSPSLMPPQMGGGQMRYGLGPNYGQQPPMGGGYGGPTIGGWPQQMQPPMGGGMRYSRSGGLALPSMGGRMQYPQPGGQMRYGLGPNYGQQQGYNPYLPMVGY